MLFAATRKKKNVAIKVLIMNARVVVGVGNIYASEALFMAGIRPGRAAKRITRVEAWRLSDAIKEVLNRSIVQGGTTLRDFVGGDGTPGLLRPAAVRVRARRGGLPALRHRGEPAGTGPALDVLVLALPAMMVPGSESTGSDADPHGVRFTRPRRACAPSLPRPPRPSTR